MRRRTTRRQMLPLVTVLAFGLWPAAAMAQDSTCPDLIKPQPRPKALLSAGTGEGQITAVAGDGTPIPKPTLVMDFGSNRGRDVRSQTFRLSPGLDPNSVHLSVVNDINNKNDPLPIGDEQLTYRVGVDHATGWVNVRVCYDPGANREPAPGRYTGSLWVSAPGATAVPLTLEFTFRDKRLVGVFLSLLLGILAGVVVQAIAAYQQAPKETRPKKIKPYLINFRTLLTVGAGFVAAATAYGRIESDPTWSSTAPTLLALAAATFGATLAAKTATDLKGPTEKEKAKGMAQS